MEAEDPYDKLDRRLRTHTLVVLYSFLGGLWITAFVMFIIMLLGIVKIGMGVNLEFDYFRFSINNEGNDISGLILILRGLELIFVSPLFYLLVLSLTKYISATQPELNPDLDTKKVNISHAIMEIMNVKILSVSLFISVLVLHALSFILKNSSGSPPIYFILSLIVILVGYYFILDLMVGKLRKKHA